MSGLKPVPVIIIAQALNGLILPFIAIFIVIVVNDPDIIGKKFLNGLLSNIFLFMVVLVTLILGITNIVKAVGGVFPGWELTGKNLTPVYLILSVIIWIYVLIISLKNRRK